MKAEELFREGRLRDAIESLGEELRENPTDSRRRVFLFELLSFAGEFDRAEKQLDAAVGSSPDSMRGALLYRSALHAERTRQRMFRTAEYPTDDVPAGPVAGTLNGERFAALQDGDPRIGARLEVFVAGQYTWLPLAQIASVTIEPPKRLRDLMWAPAVVRLDAAPPDSELGQVLMPAMAPLSWEHPDDAVRLGRVTEWQELEGGGHAPIGQKMLLVDDQAFPLLEIRELEIDRPSDDA